MIERATSQTPDKPALVLVLRPNRSLPPEGFAIFIGVTFLMLLIPLTSVLGTPMLWGLLPFTMGTLLAVYWALQRSSRDGRLTETLRLWQDKVELERVSPRGKVQRWEANPYWVTVQLHSTGGPVENYITLSGGGRDVEIGAFLSSDERVSLFDDLCRHFRKGTSLRRKA